MGFLSYVSTAIVVLICIVLVFLAVRKIVKDNRKGGNCQGCCSNCPKTQVEDKQQMHSKQGCESCNPNENKIV